ncbi:PKD domain-containing protein [Methanosarcina sp.]|uniref:PKD domain-containing protein n=1 Tax=Methanosarcina sp. TaxID=2213 RepID=UPI0029899C50|nr:PKD domain-containing protein [Methanosarcina sp.]MDW5549945.1 PKD domain-containing protein [Methanosarcina sp.]MDW5552549.1 PKD domain-containing protein [Methanosarcina sp.]MDW5560980.1 PKD domain-containing protein [Methanosarcina sp.]
MIQIYLTQWGSWVIGDGKDFTPVGVTVDSSDNVYVSDPCNGNHRIVKFNSNGYCLTQWGSQGSNNGQFNNPLGIAVDSSNNVYVVDRDNHRIQKFDSDGNYLIQWGSFGRGDGQFLASVGIATDSSGNVYVADYDSSGYHVTNRIQKFDSNGDYLTQWGSYGSSNGQFDNSNYVVVDSSGYVYVSDTNNNRIQKFAPPILPVANFSTNVTKGYVPLYVQFTDLSKNATKWKWDFGDGANSTLRNPVHTYSKAGKYTVNLTAANANGTDSKTALITVSANSVLPVAKFSAKPTSGTAPLNVAFTDTSTGTPTSWKWTFGDGKSSTLQNPAYTYSKTGNYTVSLTVKNAAGTNTKTIKNYITVKAATPKPVAAFSVTPTSGNVPLIVKFTDQSTGTPTSWKWSFGDGTYSTKKNPSYIYDEVGKYTVSLTVKNDAGSSTKTIKNYIVVNELKIPVSAFSATPTSGKAPLKVQFTDKSTNSPTSWKWSFGDGKTSTAKNPAYTYSKVGNYTVSLTVKNAKGSNTKTMPGYIKVSK